MTLGNVANRYAEKQQSFSVCATYPQYGAVVEAEAAGVVVTLMKRPLPHLLRAVLTYTRALGHLPTFGCRDPPEYERRGWASPLAMEASRFHTSNWVKDDVAIVAETNNI